MNQIEKPTKSTFCELKIIMLRGIGACQLVSMDPTVNAI